jgi:transglutaminase-like putative cysteine protease
MSLAAILGTLLMLNPPQPSHPVDELTTSGASVVWTDPSPAAAELRALIEAGDFAGVIAQASALPECPLRAESLDMLARIRRDFAFDAERVLQQLNEHFPADIGDVHRWTASGDLQHRMIDRQPAYFRRAVANLLRFNPEAQRRRDAHKSPAAQPADRHSSEFALFEHLEAVVAAADRSADEHLEPTRTRCTYTLTINANRPGAQPGSIVRAWLPYPKPYGPQRDIELLSSKPGKPVIAPDDAPQRTAYFETTIDDPSVPIVFEIEFAYTTAARYPRLDDALARPLPADWGDRYMRERLPHIVLDDTVRTLAKQIVGDESNPLHKARLIFEWMDREIRWCNEMEYGIMPSLPAKLLAERRGDCGVQSLLYISLCRAVGVPARWQSGWTTDTVKGANLHDWAEVYVKPWGWIIVDPSYGRKKHDDPRVREFYFGHVDRFRMVVNTDYGAPLVPPKQSLRSEPLDFQRGEVEIDGRNLYFNEWDYRAQFDHALP